MLSLACFIRAFIGMIALPAVAYASKTQQVSNWDDNPSGLPAALVYTPDKIASKPAIILGVCSSNSNQRLDTNTMWM